MLGNLFKGRSKAGDRPVEDKTDKNALSRRMRGVLGRDQRAEQPDMRSPALAPDGLPSLPDAADAEAAMQTIERAAEAVHGEAASRASAAPSMEPSQAPRANTVAPSLSEIRAEIEARLEALRAERQSMQSAPDDDVSSEPEPLPAAAPADTIASLDPAGEGESDDAPDDDNEPGETASDGQSFDVSEPQIVTDRLSNDGTDHKTDAVDPSQPADRDGPIQPIKMIYLSQEVMDGADPTGANELSAEIVNYLLFEAGYRSEEIAREAFCAWCVNLYQGEVQSGGMTQFIHNATGNADLWEGCRDGLEMIGARHHLAVFDSMTRLLADDAGLAAALAEARSDAETTAAMADIDSAFAQANEQESLAEMAGAWLRSLPNLAVLDSETLQDEITALADSPGLAARRAQLSGED